MQEMRLGMDTEALFYKKKIRGFCPEDICPGEVEVR